MPDSQGIIAGVTRKEADQLVLTDKEGNWPRALTNKTDGDHWDPNPSPDGKFVVFVFRPFDDLNRTDICLIDLASGAIRTIYGKPKTRAWMPRWSPDGQWLAFISQEAGWDDLWLTKTQWRWFASDKQTWSGYLGSRMVAGWKTNRLYGQPERLLQSLYNRHGIMPRI